MEFYGLLIQNREILRLFSTIVIGVICFIIVLRTNALFRISGHQGIRYFRNAFFFYGIAFIMRCLLGTSYLFSGMGVIQGYVMNTIFEFFLIMAGFSLLYSLLWRKLETKKDFSSLFNIKFLIFYSLAFVISILDRLWETYSFMFAVQIVLFGYASIICYSNIKKNKGKFFRLYFLVIILNFISLVSNLIVGSLLNWNSKGIIGIYLLNLIIFLLLFYAVMSVTKKKNNF